MNLKTKEVKGFYSKFLKKYTSEIPPNQCILMPPFGKYVAGSHIQPKWDIPEEVVIVCAVTGGQVPKEENPNQPYTDEEVARECIAALDEGATGLHIHARDPTTGRSISDGKHFRQVVDAVLEKYPIGPRNILDLGTHGAIPEYPVGKHEVLSHTAALLKTISPEERIIEVSPFRPCPTFAVDELVFCWVESGIAHVEYLQELGIKPQAVIYDHGSIDATERYFIKTGIWQPPFNWLILDGAPSTSAIGDPEAVIHSLLLYKKRIEQIDRKYDTESIIIVGECGRAGALMTTLAMMLGLHIRVGMEDTLYCYPHREELMPNNAWAVRRARAIAEALGRKVANANEYRKLMGMSPR